ncbi:MAG: GDP-mannose 4,6-dehydratase [Bacteroidia bacterium]|jgi:UDP-glucose 4-epimerase
MQSRISNKKILITGGAGFIGSHLVDHLLESGHHVTVLDDLSNGKLNNLKSAERFSAFRFIKGSILEYAPCEEACKNVEVVYHLACLGVRHSIHSPFENHRVNAEGTLNLLLAARKEKVEQFVYISTSEIYGRTTAFPITEANLTHPLTVYGASKLAGEHYTNSFFECYGMNTTVLRIFNNYGPRAHYEGDSGEIIPRTIVNVLNNIAPVIFGDGSITRDFFFVKDTAKVLGGLIGLQNIAGKTFNLGTGVEISMKHLVEQILNLVSNTELEINYLPDRPADVPRLWVDSSKIRSLLSIENEMPFIDGLRETVDFYTELNKKENLSKSIKVINWEK